MEEEEDNNPFTNGLSQMDFPYKYSDDEPRASKLDNGDSSDYFGANGNEAVTNSAGDASVSSIEADVSKIKVSRGKAAQKEDILDQKVAKHSSKVPAGNQISITSATNTKEGHAIGYVEYMIHYNGMFIQRRYREFESLRKSLVGLFPYLIVPPIPTKQTLGDLLNNAASKAIAPADLVNSNHNLASSNDNGDSFSNIVEHRKRMLTIFLNRSLQIPKIKNSELFKKFLDPNINWSDVVNQPPISRIPKNKLQCDPVNPENSKVLHSLLPIPNGRTPMNLLKTATAATTTLTSSAGSNDDSETSRLHRRGSSTEELELDSKTEENVVMNELDKVDKKINRYIGELSNYSSELAVLFNAFSLQESEKDQSAVFLEKVSALFDHNYLDLENLHKSLYLDFSEPLIELSQFSAITKKLIKFKNKKKLQIKLISDELERKETKLRGLTIGQNTNKKLNEVLNKFDDSSHQQQQPQQQPQRNSSQAMLKIPGISKVTTVFKEKIYDSDPVKTHRNKVNKLVFEVNQLKQLLELANEDYKKLDVEIAKEIEKYENYFKTIELKKLLLKYVSLMLEYFKKNLENWQEVKGVFDKEE